MAAVRARCGRPVPASATRRVSLNVNRSSPLPILTTTPRMPPSAMRTLLPCPMISNGMRCLNSQSAIYRSSSADRGRTRTSAGPPMRNETCRLSGSFSLTSRHRVLSSAATAATSFTRDSSSAFAQGGNQVVRDSPDVPRTQRDHQISAAQVRQQRLHQLILFS